MNQQLSILLLVLYIGISHSNFPAPLVDAMSNVIIGLHHEFALNCIQIFRSGDLDDVTREKVYTLWRELIKLEKGTTTGIYTFDRYVSRKKRRVWKVSCYKALKVLFEDKGLQNDYVNLTHEVRVKDSIWLMFLDTDETEFLGEADLLFDCEVIVAKIQTDDLILLYEVYRVRKDYPLRSVYYGNWTRQGGLNVFHDLLYDRRSDLEGLVFRAGCIETWPTAWMNHSKWVGFLPQVWAEIEDRTNSSTIFLKSDDDYLGVPDANMSFNGLIGMVQKQELDVIVSEIIIEKKRSHALDMFHPILFTTYQLYFEQLGYSLQWNSVFKPFKSDIWYAIIFWLIVGALVISMCHGLSAINGVDGDQEKLRSPIRALFFILQTLSQQGHHIVPQSTACRILFILSYAISSVIIPAYSGSLISYLTQQVPFRPFNSLEEMHEEGTYRLLVEDNTAEYSYFYFAKNHLLRGIFQQQILTVPEEHQIENSSHAFQILCKYPNYAFLGVELTMSISLGMVIKPECPILTMTHPVSTVYMTMAAEKNSPYSGVINHHLMRMIGVGIVKRIQHKELKRSYREPPPALRAVALGEVFQMFVFIGVSIALSFIILLIEKQYYVKQQNKKNKENCNFEFGVSQKLTVKRMSLKNYPQLKVLEPNEGFLY